MGTRRCGAVGVRCPWWMNMEEIKEELQIEKMEDFDGEDEEERENL